MIRRKLALLFAVAMSVLATLPAAAFTYKETCNGSAIRWQSSTVTFSPSLASFPSGSALRAAVEAARDGWNLHAPGTNYRIQYSWISGSFGILGDGINSIQIATPENWQSGWSNYAAITRHKRSMCYLFPGAGSHWEEADILLAPNSATQLDPSTNPTPSDTMKNATLVLLHEHGHAMGLGDEDNVLATMNSGWPSPVGGPIGTRNDVHPHGDDARGARNLYGTAVDVRDVAASTFRLGSPGFARTITAPATASRNSSVSFQFTVLNRGTTDETIPVYFYLSPTRTVDPATRFYLGATTISLQYARSITAHATVTIPSTAPTGYQYLSWVTDPTNAIAEGDEGNNAVALVNPTFIGSNSAPSACFSASPVSGNAPLNVSFNASCSTDPEGSALSYSWDFGDGSPLGSGVSVSHSYYSAGYFDATLTVTDSGGATSISRRRISVTCPAGSRWCEPE
ncbi:MAG TPA: PKD domain-containing protein [Thermoanaerobaculia bacterium]